MILREVRRQENRRNAIAPQAPECTLRTLGGVDSRNALISSNSSLLLDKSLLSRVSCLSASLVLAYSLAIIKNRHTKIGFGITGRRKMSTSLRHLH